MAMKENFISMAPDEESNAKVSPIDNNKTLMIDQYTSDAEPGNPEFVENIQNINDAFAHFRPKVEVDFVDEEGGSVTRVAAAGLVEKQPSPQEIGKTGDANKAYETGGTIGAYLKELGFNVNFAPVADLSNVEKSIMQEREYVDISERV